MILLKSDFKKGMANIKITLLDDLWYLSTIISSGDSITAKSERKIKIGSPDGKTKVTKKIVVLTLTVESSSLNDSGDQLRVKGTVLQGPEDIPSGSYHTFGLGEGDSFTLIKTEWPRFVKQRLDDAIKNSAQSILFTLYDRENALFSLVGQTGIKHLAELKVDAKKKQYENSSDDSIYSDIVKQLIEYNKQYNPQTIVVGCAAFWKQYLEKKLSDELKKKTTFITTSSIDRSSINKLLSRPELKSVLASQRLHKEELFLNKVLKKLHAEQLAYGYEDVVEAANMGAVSELGISDSFLKKAKEDGFFDDLNNIMKLVDSNQGAVHLVQSDDVRKTIDGLGGIIGILRWQL